MIIVTMEEQKYCKISESFANLCDFQKNKTYHIGHILHYFKNYISQYYIQHANGYYLPDNIKIILHLNKKFKYFYWSTIRKSIQEYHIMFISNIINVDDSTVNVCDIEKQTTGFGYNVKNIII